jgi:hypothetical protein
LRGSALSTKQMAKTVVEGRIVEFHMPDASVHSGYLCGMDDYHWMIINREMVKSLIHKAGAPRIVLPDVDSYDEIPPEIRDKMEVLVAPFRDYVQRTYFGRTEPTSIEGES